MTVSEFYKKIAEEMKLKPHLRIGQVAYLISLELIPREDWTGLYDLDCDPYHNNKKLNSFVQFLVEKGYLEN